MPRRITPLPAGLGAAFSARNARQQGVTRSRLAGRDLEHPFHGVYRRLDDGADTEGERLGDPRTLLSPGAPVSCAAHELWRPCCRRRTSSAVGPPR
ncbi:hypothetical protein J4H92_07945 [Leucobacter weissii]|uniref:Uncharacterized protein n=1 Tax=Leucobacter weissii TaxID=1983706 RepID=A0A939MRW5_9MICO|nr:hypothetical protein [Leucobacter weissii]MBO1901879.1 hypothetical protein [Leucobacter weissii]